MRKNRRKEKSRESKYKDGWMGGSKERKEGGRKEKIKSKKKKFKAKSISTIQESEILGMKENTESL